MMHGQPHIRSIIRLFLHLLEIRNNFKSAENNEDDANLSVETRFSWTKK